MQGNASNIPLPRRILGSVLLFGMAAVTWLTVAASLAVHMTECQRAESALIKAMELETAALATLAQLPSNGDTSATFIERFQLLFQPEHIAILDAAGLATAHSNPARIGFELPTPAGNIQDVAAAKRVRGNAQSGRRVREYRMPIRRGQRTSGTLVIAVRETTLWESGSRLLRQFPLGIFGAISLVMMGSVFAARQSRPIAAIESQLSNLALDPSDRTQVELLPIDDNAVPVTGWNHLVTERQSGFEFDMSHRVRIALDALKRRKVEEAMHVLPDGVAVTDEQGLITFANHALAAQLGRSTEPESLIGTHLARDLTAKTEVFDCELDNDLHYSRPVVVELEQTMEDRTQFLRVARNPIRTDDLTDHTPGHVWCIRDLTQQKIAEGSRTDFIDAATHELRTPLANIMAYAETLAACDGDIEQQKDFCNTINSEAARLARFIDDLLDISSMEAGVVSLHKSVTNMERLLREAATKLTSEIKKQQLQFHLMLPAKLPELNVDKDKISTTLVNLLGNAVKYTEPGGSVTLRARVSREELFIDVEDTGIGIAEADQPHLFERFFRSSDEKLQTITGTGLGLSLVYEVARLHGGSISVESTYGEGSKFTLTLPLA